MTIDGIIGGFLGLIGVGISLFFSYKFQKDNNKFQKEMNEKNNEFQKELSDSNHKFQLQLESQSREFEIWKKKYETLTKLVSYRFDLNGDEFSSALNSIQASFYDSKTVLDAAKDFYDILNSGYSDTYRSNDKLTELISLMFKDLDIDMNLDKRFLINVFNLK